MALSDDIALLARVPLFTGLTDDKLRLMAFGAERRRLVEGQTLFREGTSADCGFVSSIVTVIFSAMLVRLSPCRCPC